MTRILIVDDVVENRYLLEALLNGHGYEVISTANGAEALEDGLRSPPDLVIADILMPVMDGFELCRRWRATEALRNIPFIFYTGTYTDLKDQQFALNLGADRFIIKPEKAESIVAIIREVLEETKNKGHEPQIIASGNELETLRDYNEVLFHKLEKKVQDLEKEIAVHKLTEQSLRESEERFRKVFESGSIGIALIDPDIRFMRVNDEFIRMLGYSRDELLQLKLTDISEPNNSHDCTENLDRLKSKEIFLYAIESRFIKKDGSIVWSNTRVSTICDRNDRFSFFILFATDITEEKIMAERGRQALLQIEENLEQLATLNDQIRNPLAIMVARIMLEEHMKGKDQILDSVKSIDDIVTKLDEKWAESTKVREFLLRYNQISRRM